MAVPTNNVTVLSLVDSGSLHNRFALWVAETAGIDLSRASVERIAVGGTVTQARTVITALQLGEFTWEAPVSFCDLWPFDFQLLGQLGFLRWFRMEMDAAELEQSALASVVVGQAPAQVGHRHGSSGYRTCVPFRVAAVAT
ncbi:MAG: retropepsin-like domain-containing protein [Actinomycetota bacterium]|nr:retropepsin-like domain-containing protein [Actinomycetota bacterium]